MGFDTTYHFEWGTSTSYGNSVPVPDADIGSGSSDVLVSQHLSGLEREHDLSLAGGGDQLDRYHRRPGSHVHLPAAHVLRRGLLERTAAGARMPCRSCCPTAAPTSRSRRSIRMKATSRTPSKANLFSRPRWTGNGSSTNPLAPSPGRPKGNRVSSTSPRGARAVGRRGRSISRDVDPQSWGSHMWNIPTTALARSVDWCHQGRTGACRRRPGPRNLEPLRGPSPHGLLRTGDGRQPAEETGPDS